MKPHERHPCASTFEERTPEETSRQEECARKAAWDLARKIFQLKAEDGATFYFPVEIKAQVLVSKNTQERMFVVDSGASMHMLSNKEKSSEIQNSNDGGDANDTTCSATDAPSGIRITRCKDNTSKKTRFRSVNNYKELQGIHLQVKSEYVGTLTMTEMMTRLRRATSTTTC